MGNARRYRASIKIKSGLFPLPEESFWGGTTDFSLNGL